MKKKIKIASAVTLVLLGIFTCFLFNCEEDHLKTGNTEGNVVITIGTGSERTLRPSDINLSSFSKITVTFTRAGQTTVTETINNPAEGASVSTTLAVGEWSISAKGFTLINSTEYEAANGTSTVNVIDAGATGSVQLKTGIYEGKNGVFKYSVTLPSGYALLSTSNIRLIPFNTYLTNPSISGTELTSAGGRSNNLTTTAGSTSTGNYDIAPGYYYVAVTANRSTGSTVAAWSEVVHIYSGRETSASKTFIADDFRAAGRTLGGTSSITGTYRIGQTLTSVTASVTGADQIFNYQWRAGGANIAGANNSTYVIAGSDAGKQITCLVTHSVASGTITATGSTVPYNIAVALTGNESTDALTISGNAYGTVGTGINLDYTLAVIAGRPNGSLTFSGVAANIQQVTTAGTGTRTYTIAAADANVATGVITITGTFSHAALLTDTIAFANTSNETRTYGDAAFTKAITNTGAGSGAITYSSGTPATATVNSTTGAVTILVPGTTVITAAKASDGIYAQATASYTLTVNKKDVTITGLSASNKPYDANTNAAVTGTAAINGLVTGDSTYVSVTAGTASFNNKNVGTGKAVTFAGYSLSGTRADRYNLSSQPASVTANITAIQLTAGTPTYTATKTYSGTSPTNGTTALTGTVTGGTLTGVISGDTVTRTVAGTYDNANAGSGKTITIVYTIAGADAGNYIKPVDYVATNGVINKAAGTAINARASNLSSTSNSVTVGTAATLSSTTSQQTIDYAISTSNSTAPTTGWQDGLTFTAGVNQGTTYYVWARSKESQNFAAGTALASTASTTTPVSTGINITVTDNVTGHEVSFTNNTIAALNAADERTITVSGSYATYIWFVNGVRQSASGNSLTIKGVNFTPGQHQILVVVYQSGNDTPYSQTINFTVNN